MTLNSYCNICLCATNTGRAPDVDCGGDCQWCMAYIGGDVACATALVRELVKTFGPDFLEQFIDGAKS